MSCQATVCEGTCFPPQCARQQELQGQWQEIHNGTNLGMRSSVIGLHLFHSLGFMIYMLTLGS